MTAEKSPVTIAFDAKRIFHNTTGLGNYGRDVVRILTDSGQVERLFLFNPKKSSLESRVQLQKSTVLYPTGWFWRWFPSIWRVMGQWREASKLGLTAFHGLSGELPVQIGKSNIPKIVTVHDLIFLSHPHFYHFLERTIYRFKSYHALKAADRIIAISEQTKSDIIKYFKVSEDNISVIYQGCNAAFKKEHSVEHLSKIRKDFDLPERFILNVGTLEERKNALALIKAVRGTAYHVVLVGKEKKYAKKLHGYIKKHRLEGQVTFVKAISTEDLAALYQAATVFCYPSICEGFGIPIIEALYSKTPVIVSKGGCFPEAAGPGALYIDPNDENDIRAKLDWVFGHPDKVGQLVEKGLGHARSFSDKNVAKNLLAFYQNLS